MSFYSADQRCPRCQYPNPPGTLTCGNCGLAFSSTPQASYGSDPLVPPPPPPAPPGPASNPFGPPPGSGGYSNTGGYSGSPRYDFTSQQPPPYTGSSSYYTGSQPQQGFQGTAPAYAGSQPQPFAPPGLSQPPQQRRSGPRVGLIVLIVVIVVALAGGGAAVFLLSKPKPTITVTSKYMVENTAAGATTTVLQIKGQQFSGNSTVTFLLDGQIAPGSQTAQSDSNGNVTANLTVGDNWAVGHHTLTAKDANNNVTASGAPIVVVDQGADGTPGPNGAPTDNGNFSVVLTVSPQDTTTGTSLNTFKITLIVQGQSTNTAQVCDPVHDDGQQHTYTGSDNIGNYVEIFVWKCTGSYKGGKLSYTETTTTDKLTYSDGTVCTGQTPYIYTQLNGTFSDATTVSGTYSQDTIKYTCNKGGNLSVDPEKGTWSGKAT